MLFSEGSEPDGGTGNSVAYMKKADMAASEIPSAGASTSQRVLPGEVSGADQTMCSGAFVAM